MKRKFIGTNAGFTLMELLIVIVIMGFLLGMLVPRLSDVVSGDSIDNVCDSNNKGMRYYTKLYLDQKGRFPANLTNLMNETADGTYALPLIEDKDATEAETIALEFYQRNHPQAHALSAGEATELIEMGIAQVVMLNDFEGSGHATDAVPGTAIASQAAQTDAGSHRPLASKVINTGVAVAMVGDIATLPTTANWTTTSDVDYPSGNPTWYGRIILGVGKDCSLVTDGMIQAAALCPGGVQNADNVTFNNYCLILPRLDATAEALNTLGANNMTFVDSEDVTNGAQVVIAIEGQEAWQFDFTCPEGHKWPDNDNDSWNLSAID